MHLDKPGIHKHTHIVCIVRISISQNPKQTRLIRFSKKKYYPNKIQISLGLAGGRGVEGRASFQLSFDCFPSPSLNPGAPDKLHRIARPRHNDLNGKILNMMWTFVSNPVTFIKLNQTKTVFCEVPGHIALHGRDAPSNIYVNESWKEMMTRRMFRYV